MPKPAYKGKLAQPWRRQEADRDRLLADIRERIRLLFVHYGISPPDPGKDPHYSTNNPWVLLAVSLAREHVPGLHVLRAGRPESTATTAAAKARQILVALVESRRGKHGGSITDTCQYFAGRGIGKLPEYYRTREKLSTDTLRAHVARERREFAEWKARVERLMLEVSANRGSGKRDR